MEEQIEVLDQLEESKKRLIRDCEDKTLQMEEKTALVEKVSFHLLCRTLRIF